MATEAMQVVITDAGLSELINAEQTGTEKVILTQVGIGTGKYVAESSRTALESEIKRISSIAGNAVGDNVIHITVTDADGAYDVYEIGVYTDKGTLFAVYSQTTPIVSKSSASEMMLAIDILVVNAHPETIVIPDTSFVLTPATTEQTGVVELATSEETVAGIDSKRVVTPAGLSARTATTGRAGLVKLAQAQDAVTGTDNTKAITPYSLKAAFVKEHSDIGYQKLPNGLIMQWGKSLIANGSVGTTITFPTAFPTACKGVFPVSAASVAVSYIVPATAVGTATIRHNGNGGVQTYWLAIGF